MRIYLIRHGTTVHNIEKRHQHPHTPLAEEGIELIKKNVKDLSSLRIQVIYTSDLIRALHTAEIINEHLHIPLIKNEKLREIKRPTVMEGKLHKDEEIIKIKKIIKVNYHKEDWHFSDEENFFDLKRRAVNYLEEMENHKYERVLAVSHGIIIKLIASLVIIGKDLDSKTFLKIYENTSISNGAITSCEFENSKWKMLNMNSRISSNLV